MQALQEAGHDITFNWTMIEHLRPYDTNSSASEDAAIRESQGVMNADVLVVLSHESGVGMYVELGIAIGNGIPVRVVTNTKDSHTMFFHHPLVKRVESIEEIIKEFS